MILPEFVKLDIRKISKLSLADVYASLTTSSKGLTASKSIERNEQFGLNVLGEEKRLHIVVQFLNNFKNPLVLILICISGISFLVDSPLDAIIVLAMVFMSVTLNFVQEYKAGAAAEKLKERVATTVKVIRDENIIEIKSALLTYGDVIEFNAGDLIPADCRVIVAKDFFVNQSSLTGESFPVEKFPNAPLDTSAGLSDLTNILFNGTSVITGTAQAIVVKIGKSTEFGKISEKLLGTEEDNEFTRGVSSFSVMILKVIIFFVLIIFLINALLRHNILESLLFSVAVAVGLTPEFLPMIMSVAMGKGSVSMAKKGVIVKKLSAIPTFGSLDVLCTDKTGTLTQDKIELVKYVDIKGISSDQTFLYSYLNSSFQTGITNPMDSAVLNYSATHKSTVLNDVNDYKKIDEIPFDFERKRMSVVVETKGEHFLITKGAPEEVLKCCKYFNDAGVTTSLTNGNTPGVLKPFFDLSNDGFRVLAVAIKKLTENKDTYEKDSEEQMELIGYIAFLDPPKVGVKDALDSLEDMGIEIKIITGDNEYVAQKICREVDVTVKGVMLGYDMQDISDDALFHKVNDITVFARFSPDDKNRVIRALKAHGHIVGYMGDGINDAPSLKSADVGISVSNAVDVAKESADIILTDKSLDQLKDGVIEGRKTFGNTMKYIMMGISSNYGNMFSVLGAVIFLPFLPMVPIQILLNNFLYDLSQLTIPSDNVDTDFIKKPKRWSMSFIKKFMMTFGPISSFYDFLTYFTLFYFYKLHAGQFQTGWFMESLATQTLVIYVIRTRMLPFIQSRPSNYLLISTLCVVIVGWLFPYLPIGSFFGFIPLPLPIVLTLMLIVLLYLITVEVAKRLFFQRNFDMK